MRSHNFFVGFETKSFVCFYPMQKKANNFFEVVIEYMYTVFVHIYIYIITSQLHFEHTYILYIAYIFAWDQVSYRDNTHAMKLRKHIKSTKPLEPKI